MRQSSCLLHSIPNVVHANQSNRKYRADDPFPEGPMWRIFECLALGLLIIETGSEDLDGPGWDKEIVHCDIKPQNSTLADPIPFRMPC